MMRLLRGHLAKLSRLREIVIVGRRSDKLTSSLDSGSSELRKRGIFVLLHD